MSVIIRLVDRIPGRAPSGARELALESQSVTGRELIARRLRSDAELSASTPNATERLLHGEVPRGLDLDALTALAWRAFERNAFLMLVDGRQVERLDEELAVGPSSEVVFIRLVPLVGG